MEPIVPQQQSILTDIITLATSLKNNETTIAAMETTLKEAKESQRQIAETHLPALMGQLGLSELTFASGMKIKIRPEYFGSVAQARMPDAERWLEEHNMEGLLDKKIIMPGDQEIIAELEKTDLTFEVKTTINPQRLKAFVRERIEANDHDFPRELFAASQVNRAVLLTE